MITLAALRAEASNKDHFVSIDHYLSYAQRYLEFIDDIQRVQAVIVAQNEPHYRFLQYKEDGAFSVTRPLNSRLFYSAAEFSGIFPRLKELITANPGARPTDGDRVILNRSIYTIQQSIGAALDSLGVANKARKINGDLFERLIQLILTALGVDCTSGTVKVPVCLPGVAEF